MQAAFSFSFPPFFIIYTQQFIFMLLYTGVEPPKGELSGKNQFSVPFVRQLYTFWTFQQFPLIFSEYTTILALCQYFIQNLVSGICSSVRRICIFSVEARIKSPPKICDKWFFRPFFLFPEPGAWIFPPAAFFRKSRRVSCIFPFFFLVQPVQCPFLQGKMNLSRL